MDFSGLLVKPVGRSDSPMEDTEVIGFMREWDQLKSHGRVLSELLDEAVLSEILNETPMLREDMRSTVEINRHRGQFKGFSVEVDTIAQLINTGDLPNLRVINLSHELSDTQGEVGVQGALTLGRAIASGRVPYLHTIDLWGNPIGDAGVIAVAKALESGAVASLKTLALGISRVEESEDFSEIQGSKEPLKAVTRALASGNASSLEKLSLYKVVCGEEGMKLLMIGLREGGIVDLKRLRVEGSEFLSRIGSAGMRSITDSLFFSSLVELNLAGNHIEDDGIVALIAAFRSNTMKSLEILDMNQNTMSDRVLVEFIRMLEAGHLPGLLTLRLGPTHLTLVSAKAMVSAFKKNKELVTEITIVDWPRASLRDSAERSRVKNVQKVAENLQVALMERKLSKFSQQDSLRRNCFGWTLQQWKKLP